MKAIGYNQAGPITAPDALIDFETETPELGPRDLLVEVRGISVNPVDTKVRVKMAPECKGTHALLVLAIFPECANLSLDASSWKHRVHNYIL